MNQQQAAAALGITARTLREWRRRPDFPDCSSGYDLPAIRKWIETNERKGSAQRDQAAAVNLAIKAQLLRIRKLEADRREREEQIASGNILARDEMETSLSEVITLARDRLLALPKLLARLLPRNEQRRIQEEGDRIVRRTLEDLARHLDRLREGEQS